MELFLEDVAKIVDIIARNIDETLILHQFEVLMVIMFLIRGDYPRFLRIP